MSYRVDMEKNVATMLKTILSSLRRAVIGTARIRLHCQ